MLHKRVFAKKIFQFVISVLIFSLSVVIMSVSYSLSGYNYNKFLLKCFENGEMDTLVLLKGENSKDIIIGVQNQIIYPIDIELSQIPGYKESSSLSLAFKDLNLDTLTINDSLEDDEIQISDYVTDFLIQCGILPFSSYNNLIGYQLQYNGVDLCIGNIKETCYKNADYLDLSYRVISVNTSTFNKLNEVFNIDDSCGYIIDCSNKALLIEAISNANNESYSFDFKNSNKIMNYFESLKELRNTLLIICIVFMIITLIWGIYITYYKYMENKKSFQVLELYGMNKNCELLTICLEYLYSLVVTFLIGFVLSMLLSMWIDITLFPRNLFGEIHSFSTSYFLMSLLIVCVIVLLSALIGYIMSLFRKKTTHIS